MELKLSLGISPARPMEEITGFDGDRLSLEMKLGFGVGLEYEQQRRIKMNEENRVADKDLEKKEQGRWSVDPPVQLNLLPLAPVPSLDSTQEDSGGVAAERASSRGSDEEENDRGRKKLRLSRDQSASLEDNFKAHSTLNPKLKFALAKQLNLRPRQIEVWFQNRRARMKLKQMEIDCEFLRRRSEELREDNRRLCKEVAELRAIKSFHIQVPPTTLSICPSCERLSPPTSPPPPPPPTPR